jgi:hypothetical protein
MRRKEINQGEENQKRTRKRKRKIMKRRKTRGGE